MICAFTVAGIVRANPKALEAILNNSATVARFFGRLPSTVARRAWAERAAVPVCSRYAQAMTELLASVQYAVKELTHLPEDFTLYWRSFQVDAATPLPLDLELAPLHTSSMSWQADEGWVSSESDWFVWTGHVEYERVKWKMPNRSTVPALMDGGDGPPLLDVGCTVVRGSDWGGDESGAKSPNEDGKDLYEAEKLRRGQEKRKGKKSAKETEEKNPGESKSDEEQNPTVGADEGPGKAPEDPAEPGQPEAQTEAEADVKEPTEEDPGKEKVTEKVKKLPSPKLPIGTVVAIEPWNGVPAMGRRVRWLLTGVEGIYRFGGDGGRFDVCHVETNKKSTRIKKRHPVPESAEQCASRHGFGRKKKFPVICVKRSFVQRP